MLNPRLFCSQLQPPPATIQQNIECFLPQNVTKQYVEASRAATSAELLVKEVERNQRDRSDAPVAPSTDLVIAPDATV